MSSQPAIAAMSFMALADMPGMPPISGMALVPSAPISACIIGQAPVSPLAASPLRGSVAQSSRMKRVRSSRMARIIARPFRAARSVNKT